MNNKFKDQFNYFIINLEAGDLVENFLISAVFSTIFTRFFLLTFGFPTIGGDSLHISHVLWGGLLMLVAIFVLIGFLSNRSKQFASIIGGVGFGLFIDELGKYITNDNDYFYQPAIALIYVVFILIFLAARAGKKYLKVSKKDYTINAIEILKEYILYNFDNNEKKRLLYLFNKSEINNFNTRLFNIIKNNPSSGNNNEHLEIRLKHYLDKLYTKLIKKDKFIKLIVTFFILFSILQMYKAIVNFKHVDSIIEVGQLSSSIISGIFVVIGIYFLRFKQRIIAFDFFRYSILVSIFITQFFLFYQEKLSSVLLLFANIIVYMIIRYLVAQEEIYNIKTGQNKITLIKNFIFRLVK